MKIFDDYSKFSFYFLAVIPSKDAKNLLLLKFEAIFRQPEKFLAAQSLQENGHTWNRNHFSVGLGARNFVGGLRRRKMCAGICPT